MAAMFHMEYAVRLNRRMKLWEVADRLGAELRGNGDVDITGVAGIEEAGPGQITFIANQKYAALARRRRRLRRSWSSPDSPDLPTATLRMANPYLALCEGHRAVLSGAGVCAGHSPDGGDRPDRDDRGAGSHWGRMW